MDLFGSHQTNLIRFKKKKQQITVPLNNSFDLQESNHEASNNQQHFKKQLQSLKNKERLIEPQKLNSQSMDQKRSQQIINESIQHYLVPGNLHNPERFKQQIKKQKIQLVNKLQYFIEYFININSKSNKDVKIYSQQFYNLFQLRKYLLRGPLNQLKYLYQIEYTNFLSFLLYILQTKQQRFNIFQYVEDYDRIRQMIENQILQIQQIMLIQIQIKSELMFGNQFQREIQNIHINTQNFMQRFNQPKDSQKKSSKNKQLHEFSLNSQIKAQQFSNQSQRRMNSQTQKQKVQSDEQGMLIVPEITFNLIPDQKNNKIQNSNKKVMQIEQQQIVDLNNKNISTNILAIQIQEQVQVQIKSDQSPIQIDN